MNPPECKELRLFLTCPRGLEPLLAQELESFGAVRVQPRNGGVEASGEPSLAYRSCLESRLASRVLMPLANFPISNADDLYTAARGVPWPQLFAVEASFSVEVAGKSAAVSHTHFAALRVKDAIVDRFRDSVGQRPDVQAQSPDIGVHLHLGRDAATLSLDLSGESLHRRGYRGGTGAAPLKENLASALLLRARWPELAAEGAPLVDPMCGSGTLLIEAAWMAAGVAPGHRRQRFGFMAWSGYEPELWHEIREQALARGQAGLARLPAILGFDHDSRVLERARENIARAGLADKIQLQAADATRLKPPSGPAGLWICNPPYGERLGGESEVVKLLSLIGHQLREQFDGWRAALFTARPDLAPRIGLRAESMHAFFNGDLPCKLLCFDIAAGTSSAADSSFANRLRKNHKHLAKWARREGISCYRVYDADLPEYAVAVDLYQTREGEQHLHVQEYAAPSSIDAVKAEKRLRESLAALQDHFDLAAAQIHLKQRAVKKGKDQYQRQAEQQQFLQIEEYGCKLWVNLDDYLDTGLFLDHRPMRLRLQQEAQGKRVLNLFCYTGAASVHAARGGARSTLSIDLSNTYLRWAQRNLDLNQVKSWLEAREDRSKKEQRPARHRLLRADCMDWLARTAAERSDQFDLIFCDPPTFSNSKKVEDSFDVERDQEQLIQHCAALLAPGGTLYFSSNRRRFKLRPESLTGLRAEELTRATLDEDFRRGSPAHRCWAIRKG